MCMYLYCTYVFYFILISKSLPVIICDSAAPLLSYVTYVWMKTPEKAGRAGGKGGKGGGEEGVECVCFLSLSIRI